VARVPVIVVTAVDHPELDDWVRQQAAREAAASGWTVGKYLGREDILGRRRPPDACCHVFEAVTGEA
jgi:hypothetical protein